MDRFIALQTSNGSFVCAEGGGGHEVVANRPGIGPWEIFRVVPVAEDAIALKAFNGQFVCAEGGGGGKVVANRNEIGPWETFKFKNSFDLKGHSFQASNGQWLCAEGGGGFEVVANRNVAVEWETFRIHKPSEQMIAQHEAAAW